MNKNRRVHVNHKTRIPAKELVKYFFEPEKISLWFDFGDAACRLKGFDSPGIGSAGIMVMQDYYVEWYFPQPCPVGFREDEFNPDSLDYTFYEIRNLVDEQRPGITSVHLRLQQQEAFTTIAITISGQFGEEEEIEIQRAWGSIVELEPYDEQGEN